MWKVTCSLASGLLWAAGAAAVQDLPFPDLAEAGRAIAQGLGLKLSMHVTLEQLKLDPKDVYILPRPPKIENCLSALQGKPLTRMPKPYDSGIETSSLQGYEAAQVRLATAKAAGVAEQMLEPSYRPAAMVKGLDTRQFEEVPAQYQSAILAVLQAILYLVATPLAALGLNYSNRQPHIEQALTGLSGFAAFSLGLIIFINVIPLPSWLAALLASAMGVGMSAVALRRLEGSRFLQELGKKSRLIRGLTRDVVSWPLLCILFSVTCANLLYCLISGFLPGRLGVAGVFTTNVNAASLLYLFWLAAVGTGVYSALTAEHADARSAQNAVLAFGCAYCVAAGLSFFANIAAIYWNVGSFVALDPVPFFSVSTPFEFNLPTVVLLTALFLLWGTGYHLMSKRDERLTGQEGRPYMSFSVLRGESA